MVVMCGFIGIGGGSRTPTGGVRVTRIGCGRNMVGTGNKSNFLEGQCWMETSFIVQNTDSRTSRVILRILQATPMWGIMVYAILDRGVSGREMIPEFEDFIGCVEFYNNIKRLINLFL